MRGRPGRKGTIERGMRVEGGQGNTMKARGGDPSTLGRGTVEERGDRAPRKVRYEREDWGKGWGQK